MNEPATTSPATPVHHIEDFAPLRATAKGLPTSDATPGARAWLVAHSLLCVAGGHGLFLAVALTRLKGLPSLSDLGGPINAGLVAWLLACAPLAVLTGTLGSRYRSLPAGRAWTVTGVLGAVTLAAFALYLRKMVLAG